MLLNRLPVAADARRRWRRCVVLSLCLALAPLSAAAQSNDAVRALAQREKGPLLDTLKALVEIESGTADPEGVTRIGALVAADAARGIHGQGIYIDPAAEMVIVQVRLVALCRQRQPRPDVACCR